MAKFGITGINPDFLAFVKANYARVKKTRGKVKFSTVQVYKSTALKLKGMQAILRIRHKIRLYEYELLDLLVRSAVKREKQLLRLEQQGRLKKP